MSFVILNETLFFSLFYDCVDFADVGCFDNGIFVVQEKCVGVNFFFIFPHARFFLCFYQFFSCKKFFWLVIMFLYSSNLSQIYQK